MLKYHRRLSTTVNSLLDNGFQITRLDEFAQTVEQIQAQPELAIEAERPMLLLLATQR